MFSRLRPLGLTCLVTLVSLTAASTAQAAPTTVNFTATGATQTFTVPAGITSISVVLRGSQGSSTNTSFNSAPGGRGAVVTGTLPVTPGEQLCITVGDTSGFGGGGAGSFAGDGNISGPGGGATDIRRGDCTLADRLAIAAGGGGAGISSDMTARGGDAGESGAADGGNGGAPGTSSAGGAGGDAYDGGSSGTAGALGVGGAGGGSSINAGGGGGGGLYGGGGGAAGFLSGPQAVVPSGAGGGGGSSLTPPGGSFAIATVNGAGAASITYGDPQATATFPYVDSDAPQRFTVPSGVTSINVVLTGAQARVFPARGADYAGLGARVTGSLAVTPGEVLCIFVGGMSGRNGGGTGGATGFAGNGGGASDIRRGACGLQDRIAVAGGGGGSGGSAGTGVTSLSWMRGGNAGANGGGYANGAGSAGTASAGGTGGTTFESGGTSGTSGAAGQGGSGGDGPVGGGGGGGGGYFGGGGGAGGGQAYLTVNLGGGATTTIANSGPPGSGGGGGSSLVPSGGSVTTATAGGNGSVSILFADVGSPSATISSPTGDPVVRRNDGSLLADYACADAEGVKSCVGSVDGSPVADGAALPTSTEGQFTLSVTATDLLDRTATTTETYRVDGTAPTTSHDVPTDPQSGPTAIHLLAVDGPSPGAAGIDRIYYTVGANPATPTTSSSVYNPASPPVLMNGQRIRYFAVDKVGNTELPKTSPPLKAPPAFTVSLVTVPGGTGRFDVELDGAGSSANLGNTEAFGTTVAYSASLTLRVAAASGTEAAAYDLAIDCGSAGSSTSSSLALSNLTTDTSCTVTATYRPKVTIATEVQPGSALGTLKIEVGTEELLASAGNGASASTRATRSSSVAVKATPLFSDGREYLVSIRCTSGLEIRSSSGVAANGTAISTTAPSLTQDMSCLARLVRKPRVSWTTTISPAGGPTTVEILVSGTSYGTGSSGTVTVSPSTTTIINAQASVPAPTFAHTVSIDCGADGQQTGTAGALSVGLVLGNLADDATCTITANPWPKVTLNHVLLPADDPGRFALEIGGSTLVSGIGDGFSSNLRQEYGADSQAGTFASKSTDPEAYDTTIDCGTAGTVTVGTAEATLPLPALTDSVDCTVTHRRKQTITVKLARPAGTAAFDLKIGGTVVKAGAVDGESGNAVVSYGTPVDVSASASDAAQASRYDLAIDCGSGASASTGLLTLTATAARTCTVTATLRPEPVVPQAETGFTLTTSAPRAVVAVSAATSLRTRCTLSRQALRRCRVIATDAAGNRVGAGELSASGQRRSGVVNVVLNRSALERAGLRSRVLKVTLSAEATASGTRQVASATRSTLVVPAVVRVGFTAGTSTLTQGSREAIERIAQTLERAKAVECSGYVSTLLPEPTPFGLTLAGQRASAVCDALRRAGLRARFAIRNRGADRTIRDNTTPQGRALNRRVELRITL